MIRANDDQLRNLLLGQQQLVQEMHDILEAEQKKDDVLAAIVLSSRGEHVNRIARLDPDRVFPADAIERMCVRYRLRFLDAGRYKGKLPPRALYELRKLDARVEQPLKGFKIMAPAGAFKLCDANTDPLLFVAVGPRHYYLVHQWGAHLSRWRAIKVWPVRGPVQAIITLVVFSMLAAAAVPSAWLGSTPTAWWCGQRLFAMLFALLVCCSAGAFAWFTFFGKFSAEAWKDHRFN